MTTITNSGLAMTLVNALQSQQTTMAKLSQQVATGVQNVNLTDYAPPDAHNLLDFQNTITQRTSYIASMNTVSARLSVYDSTMNDMENIASQASDLATQNQTFNAQSVAGVASQVSTYLQGLTNDFNQQVDGRYIYAGSRYSTPPVVNLTGVTGPLSATPTTSPALPAYDTNYTNATTFTANKAPTGNFVFGDISIPWAQLENVSSSPINLAYSKGGTAQTPISVAVSTTNPSTPTSLAANIVAAITAVQGAQPGDPIATVTATANSGGAGIVALSSSGTPAQTITPDSSGASGETTWNGGVDGNLAQNSLPSAFVHDTAAVDTNFNITYGLTSNDPSFQKLVNGLRYMSSAVTAGNGGDTATYQADMQQAATLINAGLTGIQTLHAGVANNQNIVTQQTTLQNTDITTLKNQLASIQQVNLTQLGSELNLLQSQLQASYSSTATLEQLSLLKYL